MPKLENPTCRAGVNLEIEPSWSCILRRGGWLRMWTPPPAGCTRLRTRTQQAGRPRFCAESLGIYWSVSSSCSLHGIGSLQSRIVALLIWKSFQGENLPPQSSLTWKKADKPTFYFQGLWCDNPASVEEAPERTDDAHDVGRQGGVKNILRIWFFYQACVFYFFDD